MAVSNRGRPICMAAIDFTHDPDQELYERFYAVCRTLDCSDMRKLARAFRVDLSTVVRWTQGKRFPMTKGTARGTASLVIRWVEEGKPVEFMGQT